MEYLAHPPGVKPQPPVLEAHSLSHQTTGEVPGILSVNTSPSASTCRCSSQGHLSYTYEAEDGGRCVGPFTYSTREMDVQKEEAEGGSAAGKSQRLGPKAPQDLDKVSAFPPATPNRLRCPFPFGTVKFLIRIWFSESEVRKTRRRRRRNELKKKTTLKGSFTKLILTNAQEESELSPTFLTPPHLHVPSLYTGSP